MPNIFDLADTWNDAGTVFTAIKMNVTDTASDGASLLLDLQVGASSKFRVTKSGGVVSNGGIQASDTFGFGFQSNGSIASQGNGIFILFNSTASGFDRLQFGGTSSSFPALKRSSAVLQVRLADDSADAQLDVGVLRINQTPAANGSAATTISNGADSATNLGHQLTLNMNGTTYYIPCGSVSF